MTAHVKQGGVWYKALPYVRYGGSWYPAVAWQHINGVWAVVGGVAPIRVTVGLQFGNQYGFVAGAIGSVSPGALPVGQIQSLYVQYPSSFTLALYGTTYVNSDVVFTKLVVGNFTLMRSNASFSVAGNRTIWQWPFSANPFSSVGSTVTVTFYIGPSP